MIKEMLIKSVLIILLLLVGSFTFVQTHEMAHASVMQAHGCKNITIKTVPWRGETECTYVELAPLNDMAKDGIMVDIVGYTAYGSITLLFMILLVLSVIIIPTKGKSGK